MRIESGKFSPFGTKKTGLTLTLSGGIKLISARDKLEKTIVSTTAKTVTKRNSIINSGSPCFLPVMNFFTAESLLQTARLIHPPNERVGIYFFKKYLLIIETIRKASNNDGKKAVRA